MSKVQISDTYDVYVPDPPPDQRITTTKDVHDIIESLRCMIMVVVGAESLPPSVEVQAINLFLCSSFEALQVTEWKKLRLYGLFLTMNPVIYTDEESFAFINKTWFMWKRDRATFEAAITFELFSPLICYPAGVLKDESYARIYYHKDT